MTPELLQPIAPIYEWIVPHFIPWGLIILFLFSVAENIVLVGLFTPGEVIAVAVAFIATDIGSPLWLVFVLALTGTACGITIAYVLGRRIGVEGLRAALTRFNALHLPRFLKVDENLPDDLIEYFSEHGSLTAFTARFAYGMKGFIPPIAGALRMPFWRFLGMSLVGSSLYSVLMIFIGWFLMSNADLAAGMLRGFGIFGGAILVLLVVFVFVTIKSIGSRRRFHSSLKLPRLIQKVVDLQHTTSTNDYAKELVRSGEVERGDNVIVLARRQTQGRGQFQHTWHSPRGSLYLSFLLWPEGSVDSQIPLSRMVADTVAQTITEFGAVGVRVKEPNDVYLSAGKISGILLETSNNEGWLVIGVGINLQRPKQGFESAAYLSDSVPKVKYREFTTAFVQKFVRAYKDQNGMLTGELPVINLPE